MITQYQLTFKTHGRDIYNITELVAEKLQQTQITTGLCHVFLHHTSASLLLCENDDPQVQKDLENFMQRLVPDGDPLYQHTQEGPDDMPAHVRAILTTNFLVVPITEGRLGLGRWQGIYLWEHRLRAYDRHLTITMQG